MRKIKYPSFKKFEKDAGNLLEDIIKVFGNKETARNWFYEPSIGLNNESPYDWHKKGKTEELKDYLTRLEHGVYS